MSENAKFLNGNLMHHVAVMSFTASIGLMAIFAVDFVDMIFIGMLGKSALAAAVGYAGTVLFFTSSISIGMSIAAGVLVARSLGSGTMEKAAQSASNTALFGVLFSLVILILALVFLDPILASLGASGETLILAKRYLWILLPTMPIMMLAMIGNGLLRAHGDAKRAMYATLAGGIVNAILDPILIFGLGFELQGAAIASVFARIAMAGFSLYPIIKIYNGMSAPSFSSMRGEVRQISAIATPAVLANIATPVGAGIVTRAMAQFGDEAVAGAAVVNRLIPVAFAVVFALSGAIGPIVGQNAGAGNTARVREAFRDAVKFTAIYVGAVSVLLFLLRAPIAALFDAQGVMRDLIYLFCGPLSLGYFFVGVIFVANASFNNLGHPFYSSWVNWGRNTLGTLPFVAIGASLWGASGVLIGQMIGSVVFAIIAYWLAHWVMNKAPSGAPKEPFLHNIRQHIVASRRH